MLTNHLHNRNESVFTHKFAKIVHMCTDVNESPLVRCTTDARGRDATHEQTYAHTYTVSSFMCTINH